MADGDLPLSEPVGSTPPAARSPTPDPCLHLEAYRHRDPAWAASVAPADFFSETSDLALALNQPPPGRGHRQPWWIVSGLVVIAVVVFIVSRDWKLWRWFRPLPVSRQVILTPEPVSRPPGRVSALTRARIDNLNDAIERHDWGQAAEHARALMLDSVSAPELRRDAAAWLWLGDVAVAAAVNAGDLLDGNARRQRYRDAIAAYVEWTANGASPGLLAAYGHAIAFFYLHGGPIASDSALPPADLEAATTLLNTLGHLRSHFGPELERSPPMRDRLILVEGWTLARRLCESGRSAFLARFDRRNPDHARRWQRLAELLDAGRTRLENERDFLRLELFFWQAADSFCFNPLSANETIQVGTWSASETDIEARIVRLRTALGLPR